MNRRIEQLVEQAITQNESAWPDFKNALTGSGSLYLHVFAEKFAELIVAECVAKTMEVGEQNDEPIEPIWVANCIAHRIFKHFGVEE